MANIYATSAFDMTGIDLNWYKRNLIDSGYDLTADIIYNGHTYNSFVFVDAPDQELNFIGSGLKVNSHNGKVVAGTVTLIAEWGSFVADVPDWWIDGIRISGASLQKAYDTRSTADEKSILVKALAGADTFDLSTDGDRAYGYNGNDTMNGNSGNDALYGGNGNDFLIGGIGKDTLHGDAGNDLVNGGDGDDVLIGGAGCDTMEGGAGADQFVFDDKHSGKGALADHITDFEVGVDTIDLHLIDANTRARGDQSFRFSESGPARNAIWLVEQDGDTIIFADQNRDGKADFQIVLDGVTGVTASDFFL